MVAVVLGRRGVAGKRYRVAIDEDLLVLQKAEKQLVKVRKNLTERWGIDPVSR